MKLYATTTSERASKGQGGNNRLDIQLQGENGQELGVISLRIDKDNQEYYINYWYPNKCISINRLKIEKEKACANHKANELLQAINDN